MGSPGVGRGVPPSGSGSMFYGGLQRLVFAAIAGWRHNTPSVILGPHHVTCAPVGSLGLLLSVGVCLSLFSSSCKDTSHSGLEPTLGTA